MPAGAADRLREACQQVERLTGMSIYAGGGAHTPVGVDCLDKLLSLIPGERMDASPIFKTLDEVKREHVLNVLKAMEGDRAAAAKALAIGKRTLDMHLLDWGIVKPNQRTRKATVAASEDQR